MSWQEELRRLDEELAAGKLSADDYRLRRDQVLSSAVGVENQQLPQQPSTSSADETQVITPISPPGGIPQPNQAGGDAERTQAVAWHAQQQAQPGGAGATAFVPPVQSQPFSPPGGFAPPPNTDDSPERTQVVRNTGEYQPNYGEYTQQPPAQPGWNQVPPGSAAPPWGGGDAGAQHGANDLSWMRQGPESYFETKSKSGKKKGISIVAAVLVVLLAGFAIWWFGLRGDSNSVANPSTSNSPTSAPSTTAPPPSVAPTRVPPMPGKASEKNGTMGVDDAVDKEFLTAAEADSIKSTGSAYVTCQASTNTPFDYSVLLVNTKSVEDANRLAKAMQKPAASTNLQPVGDHAGLPQSVAVFKAVLSDHTAYRAVYVSGAAVLRIDVNQAPATDTAVTKEFQGVMKAMLENVPNS
ncbi:hypothetical protein [Amycolatopsis sp. NPDC051371]|uniref:hypothetical protein n=1 Tax=Amycolatopsis sp. NPDC051371 TaxID=3155800 RepID=UPI00344978DA